MLVRTAPSPTSKLVGNPGGLLVRVELAAWGRPFSLPGILGGAHTVVDGLSGVRNRYGDSHGKGRKPVKASARHEARRDDRRLSRCDMAGTERVADLNAAAGCFLSHPM